MSVRPCVQTYVRPSTKSSLISKKFDIQVEVDEWSTTVCRMTQSKVKVKVTSPSQLQIRPFSTTISFAIYNASWHLPQILKLWHDIISKFDRAGYLIFGLVFVSRDFELGINVSCEKSTVSPIRANLLLFFYPRYLCSRGSLKIGNTKCK